MRSALLLMLMLPAIAHAQILDKQKLLEAQTFWDNRDWDWYKANIPFFECPDADITTTYYYRWELLTKHLTYGSPNTGYTFTEFIDRPFWSGTYGAISCPAGHQLYEARWLRDPTIARDFARYWFRTPGAQPRRYSTWLADAIEAANRVHPDKEFIKSLLPDLIKNYEGWEKEHFVPEVGLFWQTGHDDGMEININSRQTQDIVRGAPGYRPTLNSYMWADTIAIGRMLDLTGNRETLDAWGHHAKHIRDDMLKKLWDPKRQFFFHLAQHDEQRDGFTVKALSFTHQTGRYAGNSHGREEIGFVPWQFGLAPGEHDPAWKFLMDKDYFLADFGPTTVERHDPMFALSKTCCWWSGQSWPYATTQTLKGLANLLQEHNQSHVSKADYLRLLQIYARAQRKNGRPYIAEACHPDTGSWEGHDSYNHSEHYFHSGYVELIITGLAGLKPRNDDTLEVHSLAPDSWAWFALDEVPYRGHRLSVVWDRDGARYSFGKGLHLLADGKVIATSKTLRPLEARLPVATAVTAAPRQVNFAVNNDGTYFPRIRASFTAAGTSANKLIDGNYWYHVSPPNRWTCEGSPNDADWCAVEFGIKRRVHTAKLYLLDDAAMIVPPEKFELEYWDGQAWVAIPQQVRTPEKPEGHRANVVRFPPLETQKLRAVFTHRRGGKSGLTEFEVWGDADGHVEPAPMPAGNLAFNPGNRPFPKVSASYTSRFDKVERVNDGIMNFQPAPANRWTSYESPHASDWLEIDFGDAKQFSRIELAIYDDRGGVQAPASYTVQWWDGTKWQDVVGVNKSPETPTGGQLNEATFNQVKATKARIVFEHKGKARSGLTEIFIWPE